MKKKLRVLAPVLALSLALSACGGGSEPKTADPNTGSNGGGSKAEPKIRSQPFFRQSLLTSKTTSLRWKRTLMLFIRI